MFLKNTQTNEISQFANPQEGWVIATEMEIQTHLLQKAKEAKKDELKNTLDTENIKPFVIAGKQINPITLALSADDTYFYFIIKKHPDNPAADPMTLLNEALQNRIVPYFADSVPANEDAKSEEVCIALTATLASAIKNHIKDRNIHNFSHYRELKIQLENAQTIEEVEAIKW